MGAAGRDFHNFNMYFRGNKDYEVVAFTAAQIPGIQCRIYPPELAGEGYPDGILVYPEEDLPQLIKEFNVDEVVFAYSDVSHVEVMRKASLVLAHGPCFRLMGPKKTMLKASLPVISVCAVRTGAGKSQTSRLIAKILKARGVRVVVLRHPMPYGDLTKQVWQRFATYDDLDRYNCTIEEREEYEPHLDNGVVVYAGVDYGKILTEAEKEAEIIVWDGGNNDLPFLQPDLHFVVADPHRANHEVTYHPGETNLRLADVVVINKVDTAIPSDVETVKANVKMFNPDALILDATSPIIVDKPELIKGKRILVVEDGPTLTHGDMPYGAATIAAKNFGALEIVNPKPYAVGSIKETLEKYSHLRGVLPAMGYSATQIAELKATIEATTCDVVLIGTPIDLRKIAQIDKPTVRVKYELTVLGPVCLEEILDSFLAKRGDKREQ
jgi:predicted GTPase